MYHIARVSREVIDNWKIDGSGLSARVENAMRHAKVSTIGQLRSMGDEQLYSYRSLGRISMQQIRKFFQVCDKISEDRLNFNSANEVFRLFLDEDERKVLTRRYGLERSDLEASRNYYTLQQIANRNGRTRERIRQVEGTALAHLDSRLAHLYLHAIADRLSVFIEKQDATVTEAELAPLLQERDITPLNPCSLLLLIHDLLDNRISRVGRTFSVLSQKELEGVQKASLDRLKAFDRPLPLEKMLNNWPDAPSDSTSPAWRKAAAVLLAQHPLVAVTRDEQYTRYDTGFGFFLMDLLKTVDKPTHFRDLAKAGNLNLQPNSQKGSGFYLKHLNLIPACRRVERGYYQLTR